MVAEDHRPDAHRPALVRIFKDGKQISEFPLTQTRYVVGRNSTADIWLDDPTVSRPHAELIRGPFGRWWVQDLGSTNSTVVRGRRVSRQMLHHRDRVGVGDFVLEFRHAPRDIAIRGSTVDSPTPIDETLRLSRLAPASSQAAITPAHLSTLTSVGRSMLETEDAQLRLDMLCSSFIDALPGDNAMALRLTPEGQSSIISGPFYRFGPEGPGPYCSSTLIQALWRTKDVVVATNLNDMGGNTKLSLSELVRPLALIACPIKRASDHMDVLWVEFPWHYATKQWGALVELAAESYAQARMVSQMRHDLRTAARVEHDLELARDVQSRLLPDCEEVRELDVAVGYEPSHWVGGDYVDALHLADGRVLLMVADVCGKGLSAALVSSSLHTMIHAVTDTEQDLQRLVTRLNTYLCAHLPASSFVTLLAVAIDPQTGNIDCLNAGHPPALVVSPEGELRWLQTESNVAVGMLEGAHYEVEHTVLREGDTLLMYTDGAFENFDALAESFDPNELASTLASIVMRSPRAGSNELSHHLSKALEARGGGQLRTDDTTFLIARRHGPQADTVATLTSEV